MRYLSDAQIEAELDGVTYKPGWSFCVYRHTWEGVCIDVAVTMPNGYNPGESVDLNIRCPVPPIVDAEHFHDWLMWRLSRIESHEMREFYRRDGELVSDPHNEDVLMV